MIYRSAISLFFFLLPVLVMAAPKPNVLFIAVDDLRPQLGVYGDRLVKSPNLDRLSSQSVVFNRAYCQYPLCNPSRLSLLTGLRPETLKVFDLKTNIRDVRPEIVTLPQLFKNNGYSALSVGKIFHTTNGNRPDPESWTATLPASKKALNEAEQEPDAPEAPKETTAPAKKKPKAAATKKIANADPKADMPPYGSPDVADDDLHDGRVARVAINALRDHKDKPFFLAVGFSKPHMPFLAPKKYWDLYDPATIPLAANRFHPKGAPEFASNQASELRRYKGVDKIGPISDEEQRNLIHGYLACVSYVDAQIGLVINELDRLGLRDNTIIVLWGDHGYQLGEHNTWNKRTNWETAARVPMLVSTPETSASAAKTDALVELVDIYPTLAELAGLEVPHELEGTSLVPLLKKPGAPWKRAAFTVYESGVDPAEDHFGVSMRTDRYRFIRWTGRKTGAKNYELYDHTADPQENESISGKPEHAELVKMLEAQLEEGWKGARP